MTDDDDHLTDEPKLRVLVNSNANMSRGKMAAHVAHAVLTAAGVHPHIPVVVLGAKPSEIEGMRTVIRDAGRTELEPGTLTAGTDWHPDESVHAPSAAEATASPRAGIPSNNVDTRDLPLPAVLAMADFVAENPTAMAPAVISQTIRDPIERLRPADTEKEPEEHP